MKPRLLFLTNRDNDEPQEDELLLELLSEDFDFMVSHPLGCEGFLDQVEGVVIRNIWPTHEYDEELEKVKAHLRTKNMPTYGPLVFRGDIEGKDYLVDLFRQGYPVIPSVDRAEDLHWLPEGERYWVKPKKSCAGTGARTMTREEIVSEGLMDMIIQPFMEFTEEPMFFFVDDAFHHAIAKKHRLSDEATKEMEASREDLAFARRFVEWAGMGHGINRIDAIRTKAGELLLTEVENFCPYLFLSDLSPATRIRFLSTLRRSLHRFISVA